LRIIAGSGLNGISMIARTATSATELKGKRVGTSKGDSLEVFAIELMDKAGVPLGAYELVYFTDPFEAIEAIKAGRIDAVTHVEPFATGMVEDNGMKRVATSEQLWGTHPDAVLLTTESSLKAHRKDLEWLVAALKQSTEEINKTPEKAAENLAKTFYNMPSDKLLRILQRQAPRIDIREYQGFFLQRYETLRRVKYVDGPLRADAFDWSLLK
jgi:NitT/TauT family transport system substrate-binding protein